ncbi:MAG: hypothetical protein Q9172_007092 [Xanthocarpia lactea]
MPPTLKPHFKLPRERQDPDIGKRLTKPSHIKAIKDHERDLYELEKHTEEVQAAEQAFALKLARVGKLQDQKKQMQSEMATQSKRLQDTMASNEDLKEELLKHQPSNQIADSQIIEQYSLLQENISSWVDTQVSRITEEAVFRHGGVQAFVAFLGADYRFGGQYLVESQVHLHLHEFLFNDDELFSEKFLGAVEDGFVDSDPLKEASSIRDLRSEILKAFAASQSFKARRARWMSETGMDILKRAESILPELPEVNAATFKSRILDVAFDLAIAIKTSATRYNFSERMTHELQFEGLALKSYHWDSHTMVNIATRSTLKKEKVIGNGDAFIAQQILLVAPGLVRYLTGSTIPHRLTPDVVCVTVKPTLRKIVGHSPRKNEVDSDLDSEMIDQHLGTRETFKTKQVESMDGTNAIKIKHAPSNKCISTEDEHDGPAIISDDTEDPSPKTQSRQLKRKTKDRDALNAVDLDESDGVKTEPGRDRSRRKIKAPLPLALGKGDSNMVRELDLQLETRSVEEREVPTTQ